MVCDMAGTTVKDDHEVEMCFTRAALSTNLRMTDEEILAVQGWSKKYVFEVFWERQVGARNEEWTERVDYSYEVFRKILEEYYQSHLVKPTEGCIELFGFLRSNNIPVALTTGFYRKVTNIILGKLGWLEGLDENYRGNSSSMIQLSIASDEVANGRPQPDMIQKAMKTFGVTDAANVFNIGDTPSDIVSGKNAGCGISACVTNGTHTKAQLQSSQPTHMFGSLNDVISWMKS